MHLPGRRPRRLRSLAALATLALALAACGSMEETPAAVDAAGAASYLTPEQRTEIQTLVEEAGAVPEWTAPGPAFDITPAAGTRWFVIPTASQLADCDIIARQVVDIVNSLGMEGTYFENPGGTQAHIQGVQQATAQGYDAIVFICGIDPNLLAPQVRAATDAGITVLSSGLYDTTLGNDVDPLLSAQTNVEGYEAVRRSFLPAFLQNDEPFNTLLVTAEEVPSSGPMGAAINDAIQEYCDECELRTVNVPIPDWGTRITPEVQAALVADPNIKAVVPLYGGMTPQAMAAITGAGRTDVQTYVNYSLPVEFIAQMEDGAIPSQSTARQSNLWRAYATVDQTLRQLTGAGALPPNDQADPHRVFLPSNAADIVDLPNEGFTEDFVTGYRGLWQTN